MTLTLIWAQAQNNIIGKDNKMPWYIPEELEHFKQVTSGHAIVFGYNTLKGFNGRLLPNRTIILHTENPNINWKDLGLDKVSVDKLQNFVLMTTDEIIEYAETNEVFIAGGLATYNTFFPYATKIIRTKIHQDYDGDTYAPDFDENQYKLITQEHHTAKPSWTIETYELKQP